MPSNTNPVECANLASLLAQLANNIPRRESLGIDTIGISIVPAE